MNKKKDPQQQKHFYFMNISLSLYSKLLTIFRLGIPLVVVIGRGACDPENPQFELHFMYDEKQCDLTLNNLIDEIMNFSNDKLKID